MSNDNKNQREGSGAAGIMPQAFYQDDLVTIYCGDARAVLPQLRARFDCIITDPVWPNCPADLLPGADDPAALFSDVAQHFPGLADRLVVHLGCDSDPRFLCGVPDEYEYLRQCVFERPFPGFKGRVLYLHDVAHVYGNAPPSEKGKHLMPGRCQTGSAGKETRAHPTPRQLAHVKWLVGNFVRGPVLDPFCGSGTTLLAAKQMGYPSVGIELEERWAEAAARRLAQGALPLPVEVAA